MFQCLFEMLQNKSSSGISFQFVSSCCMLKVRTEIQERPGWCCFPLAFSSAVSADAGTCSIFLRFLWFCLSLVAALSPYPAISTALLSLPCYVKTQKWLRKHLNLCYLGKQLILEASATYTTECLRFLPCHGDVMPHLLRLEGMYNAS